MIKKIWTWLFGERCRHDWREIGSETVKHEGEPAIRMTWKCQKCGKLDRAHYQE